MRKYLFILLFTCFTFLTAFSQSNNGIEMASGLRSSGKIYVVVIGLVVIFVGLIIYLFTIDRKISKLEKKSKND